jgi:hypothetical protein
MNVLDRLAAYTAGRVPQHEPPPALPTHMDLPEPYGPDPVVFGCERYWEPPPSLPPRRMICEPCGYLWNGPQPCEMCGQPGVPQFQKIR